MRTFVKKLNHALLFLLLAVGLLCPLRAAAVDENTYQVTTQIPVSVDVNENYKATFTLRLTAVEDGTPMPEVTELSFTGGGSGNFGPITYTAPGDYCYQVTQVAGSDDNVTYDESVYNVTVRVTNKGEDSLQADVWARRNEETGKADVAAFHNVYTAPQQGGQATATPAPTATPVPTATPAGGLMGGLLPQTGDDFPLTAVIVIFVIAALCLGYLLYRKNRNNKK